MSNYAAPSVATHIPEKAELPTEPTDLAVGRPDIPPPSLWQESVKVRHKRTGEPAIVARVDWKMNMFRAFYPERMGKNGEKGAWSERTQWEHCREWDVEVTFSPAELERQAAAEKLRQEIASLDADALAAVTALVETDDPAKALAKLEALRRLGVIKGAPSVVKAAVDGKKGK